MQFQGNLQVAILGLLMKEGNLDTFMVATSKVLMTLVKVQMLDTHGSNHLVMTGQDSGEVNQLYTLVQVPLEPTLFKTMESHMGMIWHNVTDDLINSRVIF